MILNLFVWGKNVSKFFFVSFFFSLRVLIYSFVVGDEVEFWNSCKKNKWNIQFM